MTRKSVEKLEEWEIASLRIIACQARWKGFSKRGVDYEDLLQECLLHWVKARKSLDFSIVKNPGVFMRRVIDNKMKDLVVRECRDGVGKLVSFDAHTALSRFERQDAAAASGQLAHAVDDAEPHYVAEALDTALDFSRVLEQLTPEQRALCEVLFMEEQSLTEAAKKTGISRAKTYRELLRLRGIFLEFGLKNYFS